MPGCGALEDGAVGGGSLGILGWPGILGSQVLGLQMLLCFSGALLDCLRSDMLKDNLFDHSHGNLDW